MTNSPEEIGHVARIIVWLVLDLGIFLITYNAAHVFKNVFKNRPWHESVINIIFMGWGTWLTMEMLMTMLLN